MTRTFYEFITID